MKFSWKQIKYILSGSMHYFLNDIGIFFFRVRVKFLAWWYGGGDKIPSNKLGNIIVGGQDAANDLLRIVHVVEVCNKISDYFQIPEDRRVFITLVAKYTRGMIADVELDEAIGRKINSTLMRTNILDAMTRMGEITELDYCTARARGDWGEFCIWINTLVDERGNQKKK